ncbi:MAG: DUF1186 domain-containing protein [Candidatus Latescibacterota bacterium]
MDIKDILESFEFFDGKYKREQVGFAIGKREEITPHLLYILHETLESAEQYVEDKNRYAHIYALFLLAHFKEPQAHGLIVDLFSLPGDISKNLFGDIITEDLPVILLRTCNRNPERIKGLVSNTAADEYCRASAARAIIFGVVEGIIPREEAIAFFESAFTGGQTGYVSDFHSGLACCIHDIYPEELMKTIEAAFKNGMIDPWRIGLHNFKRALLKGKEACLEDLKRELACRSLDNLHKTMSGWACFRQDTSSPFPAKLSASDGSIERERTKKNRRKIATASKKKNRKTKKKR